MLDHAFLKKIGKPIVVATHMRSGTHLTLDLLRRQFKSCRSWKLPGEQNDVLYLALDALSVLKATWGEKRARKILKRGSSPLLKVHWTSPDLSDLRKKQPHVADWLDESGRFIYVVRNPYKVMASMWAWELSSDLGGDRSSEVGMPDEEWTRAKFTYWVQHLKAWRLRKGCHILQFENLTKNSLTTLEGISRFLGEAHINRQPILPAKLRGRWHSRINRFCSIRPASTEIVTTVSPCDPKLLFADPRLRKIVDECAGDEMTELGYSLDL